MTPSHGSSYFIVPELLDRLFDQRIEPLAALGDVVQDLPSHTRIPEFVQMVRRPGHSFLGPCVTKNLPIWLAM